MRKNENRANRSPCLLGKCDYCLDLEKRTAALELLKDKRLPSNFSEILLNMEAHEDCMAAVMYNNAINDVLTVIDTGKPPVAPKGYIPFSEHKDRYGKRQYWAGYIKGTFVLLCLVLVIMLV